MQYARLEIDGKAVLSAYQDGLYYPLKDEQGMPVDLVRAMAAGFQLSGQTRAALLGGAAQGYRYLPAVPKGGKLICVGTNYKKHLLEVGLPFPDCPVLFSKFDSALAAHEEEIALPQIAGQVDYEAELVLVVRQRGKGLTKEEALDYVFGYTCGNDLSARDLQFLTSQWLLGKTPDGFAPLGPHIRTLEGVDPDHLAISLRLNGEVRQQAVTSEMIFDCAALVSYISQTITLLPGDVIFTGTPDGVIQGFTPEERQWLKAGDVLEVEIEGLIPLRSKLI